MSIVVGIVALVLFAIAYWPVKRRWDNEDAEDHAAQQRYLDNLRRDNSRRRRGF